MKSVLLGCLCLFSLSVMAAPLTVSQVIDRLALEEQKSLISGHFVQQKYFKILSKPFVSEGEFMLDDGSLQWRTLKPVKSVVEYQDGKLYQTDSLGVRRESQVSQQFSQVLHALLQGKFDQLADSFTFSATELPHCVRLIPINGQIKQAIQSVKVCGQVRIEQIEIQDSQQNTSKISLNYSQPN